MPITMTVKTRNTLKAAATAAIDGLIENEYTVPEIDIPDWKINLRIDLAASARHDNAFKYFDFAVTLTLTTRDLKSHH